MGIYQHYTGICSYSDYEPSLAWHLLADYQEAKVRRLNMVIFVASYLIGVIVILGIWGIIAYKMQVARGEIEEE